MSKHWNDQPDAVADYEVVLSANNKNGVVEVRERDEVYYVTIGNLFGSQTVECKSAKALLKVLALAFGRRTLPQTPPEGVILLANGEAEERA